MNIREEDIRTAAVIGGGAVDILKHSHVAVFGVGGVGGSVCEALARAGVGKLTLIDGDVVSLSNINRQIVALHSTVGRPKTEVMRERILDIDPECVVDIVSDFYRPGEPLPFDTADYIADAIDDVPAKTALIVAAKEKNIRVISAMGAGNKLDPTRFRVTDIEKTQTCPLAKTMRRELRLRGITDVKAVWSDEPPIKNGEGIVGSVSFVPTAAGLVLAGEIIKDLINKR